MQTVSCFWTETRQTVSCCWTETGQALPVLEQRLENIVLFLDEWLGNVLYWRSRVTGPGMSAFDRKLDKDVFLDPCPHSVLPQR